MSAEQNTPVTEPSADTLVREFRNSARETRRSSLMCEAAWQALAAAIVERRTEHAATLLASPMLLGMPDIARKHIGSTLFGAVGKDDIASADKLFDLANQLGVVYRDYIYVDGEMTSLSRPCVATGSLAMADLLLARGVCFDAKDVRSIMYKALISPEANHKMAEKVMASLRSMSNDVARDLAAMADRLFSQDPQNKTAEFVRDEALSRIAANRAANPGPLRRLWRRVCGQPTSPSPGTAT